MIEQLPRQRVDGAAPDVRPLAGLTTRSTDDLSMAFLDGWATVLDVLTFYQERIANEGFLRTATERRSVVELARGVGYEPNPGLAASTHLALTLMDAPGAPRRVNLDEGLRVTSVPGPGEKAQTFETTEPVLARVEWNAMRPRRTIIPPLPNNATSAGLKGLATMLQPGDSLLIMGWRILGALPSFAQHVCTVGTVTPQSDKDRTDVTWDQPMPGAPFAGLPLAVLAFRQRANLFGFNAPDWKTLPTAVKRVYDPNAVPPELKNTSDLPEPKASAFPEDIKAQLLHHFFPEHRTDNPFGFGHPFWGYAYAETESDEGLPEDLARFLNMHFQYHSLLGFFVPPSRRTELLPYLLPTPGTDASGADAATAPATEWPGFEIQTANSAEVDLDQTYPKIQPGSFVGLMLPTMRRVYQVKAATTVPRIDFTLNSKVSRLQLNTHLALDGFGLRETVVLGQSEALNWADLTDESPLSGDTIILDAAVPALPAGRVVIVSGFRPWDGPDAEPVAESAVVRSCTAVGKRTRLVLKTALTRSYRRKDVVVYGNVAPAGHGESVREILGSGNAALGRQRFFLKRPPLTQISASAAGGSQDTLVVRVDGQTWEERATLYAARPDEAVYRVRVEDDGRTEVLFGDGTAGRRLPSGRENVAAVYRSGLGKAGNVKPRTLTVLQSRPLGLQEATNPTPALGGADPEPLERARVGAPREVMTLDRVVSLQDFEDFAAAFSGVAKARAAPLWNGHETVVHITVAGDAGTLVDDATRNNLVEAIRDAQDRARNLAVANFEARYFRIKGRLFTDGSFAKEDVEEGVRSSLARAFSFEERQFGQDVTGSEIVSVIHSVPGVVGVDLDEIAFADPPTGGFSPLKFLSNPKLMKLTKSATPVFGPARLFAGQSSAIGKTLPAHMARREGGALRPAQLLTLRPDAIDLVPVVASK